MPVLRATDVVCGYGGGDVLRGMSFELAPGEFVGLLGPNGAGKSTLLRTLSGVLPVSAGTVAIDDVPIQRFERNEIARTVAFVPQSESTAFDFTARDIVLMGRYAHGTSNRASPGSEYDIVDEALAEVDALHLADRPVSHLSGGEHRRILFARALAQRAPLMLLDEPGAHLDLLHHAAVLRLVARRTTEAGMGAAAAVHDLNAAAEFCTRLVLMRDGRSIAEGSPAVVLTPENLRLAYDAAATVGVNPATGSPCVFAVAPLSDAGTAGGSCHVVCGGGSGVAVMAALDRAGYTVSVGVVNQYDQDADAAAALALAVAIEKPFAPIGVESMAACRSMMDRADLIVVAPAPVGHGNLANLRLVQEQQRAGKRVLLLGGSTDAERDFTSGAATQLLRELRSAGAECAATIEDWLLARPAGGHESRKESATPEDDE